MNRLYEAALDRLVRYRKALGLTQKRAGEMLGVTQSQYSKLERGSTIMSFEMLCCMERQGWDVGSILVGEEAEAEKRVLLCIRKTDGFFAIRKRMGYSQLAFSQLIGVGIRTYRKLEKGGKKPDAELICALIEIVLWSDR